MAGREVRQGFRAKLLWFLRENPGEYLTIDDASTKFDQKRDHVISVAYLMRKDRELAPGPDIRLPA